MTWYRSDLSKKDFFYDENIPNTTISSAPFPPHVEALRKSILDFSCQVLDSNSDGDIDTQHRAKNISQGGYSERYWEDFFRERFFDPLVRSTLVSHLDSRRLERGTINDSYTDDQYQRVSRCNYYYDAIVRDSDASWNLFDGSPDDTSNSVLPDFESVKIPKPDYVFYLPMYNLGTESHIPAILDPKARGWHKNPNPSLVEPFSWSVLKDLFTYGLRPTPFKTFQKVQREQREPREADLKCFPWLVVEYKKEKYRENDVMRLEESVCCQAANATACAIKLNQVAARYAVQQVENAQVPPIPAITTVGSRVKVWITYFAKDFQAPYTERYCDIVRWKSCNKGYVMRCIWKGDMTDIDDIVKLRLVLENTYTWATRVYKPQISSYIDQWRFVHCHSGTDSVNTAMVQRQQTMELSQKAMPLIQSILDRHSSIEIDDSKHSQLTPLLTGLLIQQVCAVERQALTAEIERIVTESIASLSFDSTTSSLLESERDTCLAISESSYSESRQSPTPTDNNDDPTDGNYMDSQETASRAEQDDSPYLRCSLRTKSQISPLDRNSPPAPATNASSPGPSLATESSAVSNTTTASPRTPTKTPVLETQVRFFASPEHARASDQISPESLETRPSLSAIPTFVDSTDERNVQNRHPELSSKQNISDTTADKPSKSILVNFNEERWPRGKLFGQTDSPSDFPGADRNPAVESSSVDWRPSAWQSRDRKGLFNPTNNAGNKESSNRKETDEA